VQTSKATISLINLNTEHFLDTMKTRGVKTNKGTTKTAAEADESAKSTTPKVQLGPDSINPPQLLVLPKDLSKDARIVSLQNPRYDSESRYIICPELGIYEFKEVAASKFTPRSWLLSQDSEDNSKGTRDNGIHKGIKPVEGYVTKTAKMLVATAMDPLFIALPALAPWETKDSKKLFLSGEDYLEKIAAASPHFNTFSRFESVQSLLEKRMRAVCDTVGAGDEIMYRLNEEKLLGELLKKARRVVKKGLPASLEEKFVRKALDVPVMSISREETNELIRAEEAASQIAAEIPGSQTTTSASDSTGTSFSEASTAVTLCSEDPQTFQVQKPSPVSEIKAPGGVAELLRLRTALTLIFSTYLPPHITESLNNLITTSTTIADFAPLETHLVSLAKMRSEAQAMRSLGDFSRKRSLLEDDDDTETRAEKKRKLEEEEKKKKAGESRGVKNLKKVNVSGMKKMSDFFKKKA
jgi:hypothetical protein